MPIQIGLGNSFFKNSTNSGEKKILKHPVVVYETNLTGHFRLIKYLAIGFGAGYRLMLVNNKEIEQQFNSPVYHLYLKIYFSDIYNDLFH